VLFVAVCAGNLGVVGAGGAAQAPALARLQAGETQTDIAPSFAVDATTIGGLQG
jgi:hypothetical protein